MQPLQPALLVAVVDLVAGLAGDPELLTGLGHRPAVELARHKPQSLIDLVTLDQV